MFDHVGIRVSDRQRSVAFYDTVLAALGVLQMDTHEPGLVEYGEFALEAGDAEHPVTRNLHVAFRAPDRAAVDAFHAAGVQAGFASDGEPGPRPQYTEAYYGAFLLDPDGNSVEAVTGTGREPGAQIDHLWLRVPDVDAVAAFYAAVAPWTGFAPTGNATEHGIAQFADAQSSFCVVAESAERPAVTGLHIAFPGPDHATVEAFHAAALAAGGVDHGAPGERPQYHPGYYGAFVLDPAGTNAEVVDHGRG